MWSIPTVFRGYDLPRGGLRRARTRSDSPWIRTPTRSPTPMVRSSHRLSMSSAMPRMTLRGSWFSGRGLRFLLFLPGRSGQHLDAESGPLYRPYERIADYMALAHWGGDRPLAGPKHYIPGGVLLPDGFVYRRADQSARRRDHGDVGGHGRRFAVVGSASGSGRYEIGEYPYRLITEGSGGMVEFSPADFASEEGAATTVATSGRAADAPCCRDMPDLQVKVTLTSDGKELKLDASLCGSHLRAGLSLCG